MEKPKVLRSVRAYSGSVVGLRVDDIRYPDGHIGEREVVEHPGGAVVVPFLPDGRIVFVRQYRHPIADMVYELPAGKLESGEHPEHCARRELEEETGYTASMLTPLGSIMTTPGFCDEVLHIFAANDCVPHPRGQHLDPGESLLTLHILERTELLRMVHEGTIRDGKTLSGLFLTLNHMGMLV